jgi:hypothetical protein
MITQFLGLERRMSRSGKDSVDHGPSGHDDVSNAVAGAFAIVGSSGKNTGFLEFMRMEAEAQRASRVDGAVMTDLKVSKDGVFMPWAI